MLDVEPFVSCFLNLSAAHLPLFTSLKKTLNWLWNRLLLSEALPATEFLKSSFILPRRYGAAHLDRMVYKMYSFILLWLFVGLLLMLNGASYPDAPHPPHPHNGTVRWHVSNRGSNPRVPVRSYARLFFFLLLTFVYCFKADRRRCGSTEVLFSLPVFSFNFCFHRSWIPIRKWIGVESSGHLN